MEFKQNSEVVKLFNSSKTIEGYVVLLWISLIVLSAAYFALTYAWYWGLIVLLIGIIIYFVGTLISLTIINIFIIEPRHKKIMKLLREQLETSGISVNHFYAEKVEDNLSIFIIDVNKKILLKTSPQNQFTPEVLYPQQITHVQTVTKTVMKVTGASGQPIKDDTHLEIQYLNSDNLVKTWVLNFTGRRVEAEEASTTIKLLQNQSHNENTISQAA